MRAKRTLGEADPPMDIEVREDRAASGGSRNFWYFEAYCGGKYCGKISTAKSRLHGKPAHVVLDVLVLDPWRRRGVATKLYEAALANACDKNAGVLVSAERYPWARSNEFWAKQLFKGRAKVTCNRAGKPPVFYIDDCIHKRNLSGLRRRR